MGAVDSFVLLAMFEVKSIAKEMSGSSLQWMMLSILFG
jgi:hypothetical protein